MSADPAELERYRPQLAAALGRPLAADDLAQVATVEALSASQRSILRVIGDRSQPYALVYLRAVVPSLSLGEAFPALRALIG
jgi:DNA-directed RNA polymerase specialized sigma24 family protein